MKQQKERRFKLKARLLDDEWLRPYENAIRGRSARAFEKAVELGFTKWDTAAVYGMGSCEKLLGGFINGRNDIFLSTKYFPNKKYNNGDLEKSFNESMTRLGLKSADLFWIHKPNNLKENLNEAIPLMKDGRIRSIGISFNILSEE